MAAAPWRRHHGGGTMLQAAGTKSLFVCGMRASSHSSSVNVKTTYRTPQRAPHRPQAASCTLRTPPGRFRALCSQRPDLTLESLYVLGGVLLLGALCSHTKARYKDINRSLKSRLTRQTASGSREGLDTRSGEAIRHLSAHFRGHGALIQVAILRRPKVLIPCKKR